MTDEHGDFKKSRLRKQHAPGISGVDRLPPHSLEAEQGVLGCCLLAPAESINLAGERFKHTVEVFYDLRHQVLFSHLLAMQKHGEAIDLVTLTGRLSVAHELEEVGGVGYLSSVMDAVPSAANLPYYLDIVWEKYQLRRVLQTAAKVSAIIYEPEMLDGRQRTLEQALDEIEKEFMAFTALRTSKKEASAQELTIATMDEIEEYQRGKGAMRGLSTGFAYLDKMLCGMQPGQFIIVAARPGFGKTSLGMNVVEHVGLDLRVPCGVFSLEMTKEELWSRLMFQRARADYQRYRTGYLTSDDTEKLPAVAKQLLTAPIWVDDEASISIMELRSKARRMVQEHGIRLMMVDYVQLMKGERGKHYNSRADELTDVSNGLKALAKELRIPVLALAQLNREAEKESRKPRMSDLADCSALEKDADALMFIWEPKLKDEQQREVVQQLGGDWSNWSHRRNVFVAKQRNGPTGDCEMIFRKSCMRFEQYKRNAAAVVAPDEGED